MCLMRDSRGCRSPDPPPGKFKLINLPKWTSELPGKQKYVTDHPSPGKPSSGSALCVSKSRVHDAVCKSSEYSDHQEP